MRTIRVFAVTMMLGLAAGPARAQSPTPTPSPSPSPSPTQTQAQSPAPSPSPSPSPSPTPAPKAAAPTRYCWIDAKTGKQVPTMPIGLSGDDASTILNEPGHFHNSRTGQNFSQQPDGSWLDSKTGQSVNTQPTGLSGDDASTILNDPNHRHNSRTGQNYVRVPCPPPPTQTAGARPGAGGSAAGTPIRPLPDHALQSGDAVRVDGTTWVKVNPTTGERTHAWDGRQWVSIPAGSVGTPAAGATTAPGPNLTALRTTIQQFEKRDTPVTTSPPAPTVAAPSASRTLEDRRGRGAPPATPSTSASPPPTPTVAVATPAPTASRGTPPAPPASTFLTDPSGRRWTPVKNAAGNITHYAPVDLPRGSAVYAWSVTAHAFVHQGPPPAASGEGIKGPADGARPVPPAATERPTGLPGPR